MADDYYYDSNSPSDFYQSDYSPDYSSGYSPSYSDYYYQPEYSAPFQTGDYGVYSGPSEVYSYQPEQYTPYATGDAGVYSGPESLYGRAEYAAPQMVEQQRQQPQESNGGIGGLLTQAANLLASPEGKLLASLGGGALSAYGAMKQNKMQKQSAAKYQEELAKRRAEAMRFNEPLRLQATRAAVAAPVARRGESQFFTGNALPRYYAKGGLAGYVKGGQTGQSDKVPAMLSSGEYVIDADVVSALGDGNNSAGAKKLDQMRQNLRAEKRSAPSSEIPPKAKSPLAYMKKGAK